MATDRILADRRYDVTLIRPTHKPFENNLHHIIGDVMAGGYDFWLSIDADNPPMANPLDLIAYDRDVMGLPTPVWHWTGEAGERPIYWNAYRKNGVGYNEWLPRDGLQKVDAIGTGCFLVARRVFESPAMRLAPFQRTYKADGTVEKGNDIAFCERATARGFEVWCHFGYPCRHFVELDLTEVVAAFKGLGVA